MGNRRKSRAERRAKAGEITGLEFGRVDPAGHAVTLGGFNQMARSNCDECGAPVEWLTGAEAEARGVDLSGGMEFLGVDEIPGKDVWACTRCDNFGIMGPAHGFL